MKYRSRSDITAQILEGARGGATKTKIMYKAFLSYQQLKEYLQVLEENGLLAHDETSMTFRTTPKGHQFIDIHNRLSEISGLAIIDGTQGTRQRRSSKLR